MYAPHFPRTFGQTHQNDSIVPHEQISARDCEASI